MKLRQSIRSLEFKDLSLRLSSGELVFENLNFEFPQKSLVGFESKAGAGKSTLMRLLDGLIGPTSGRYLVNGKDVCAMSFSEFNEYRLNMGYSFDFGGLINNKSLEENLSLPLEYHQFFTHKESRKRVRELLTQFGLRGDADKRPSAVPGAVRKALCVARAFVHQPQVVLLDDPFVGLRSEAQGNLLEILTQYRHQVPDSVVFVACEDFSATKGLVDEFVEVGQWQFVSRRTQGEAA